MIPRLILGALFPLLLQCLFVFIVVEMNTGNGSWVGLGAVLIGMFAIPATFVTNILLLRESRDKHWLFAIARCFAVAFLMPILVVILLAFG